MNELDQFKYSIENDLNSKLKLFVDAEILHQNPDEYLKNNGYKFYIYYKENDVEINCYKKNTDGIEYMAYYPNLTFNWKYPICIKLLK